MSHYKFVSILVAVSLLIGLFSTSFPVHANELPPPSAAPARLAAPPTPITPKWDETNIQHAFDPANRRGSNPVYAALGVIPNAYAALGVTRYALESGGDVGSSSFQFDVPVLNLPGRGLDLNLNLHYNSLLWTRLDKMVFDADGDWPVPGWALGFGKLIASYNGAMLIDGDGTRHYAAEVVTTKSADSSVRRMSARTKDGSLISCRIIWIWSSTPGVLRDFGSTCYLPSGTAIVYGASSSAGVAYPTRLTDVNGNTISIAYRNNQGPAIDTITDTLGRVVRFYYDQDNDLTAIEAPGLAGGTRTVVRLHYRFVPLTEHRDRNPGFDESVLRCAIKDFPDPHHCLLFPYQTGTIGVDAIYFPGTDTGYWFGSYSSYGMLQRVSERRAMKLTAGSLTEQGKLDSPGMMTRERYYNYPERPDYTLTSSPRYTTMEETWVSGQSQQSATTEYSIKRCPEIRPECGAPSQVEVTYPDGTRSIQVSHEVRGQFDDGMVYDTQLVDKQGKVLQEQVIVWEKGEVGAPRLKRVETFGEMSQKAVIEYGYGPKHNQVTEIRTYDYDGVTLLRREQREYVSDPTYVLAPPHLLNLPRVDRVFDGSSSIPISLVEYAYDGEALVDTPGVTSHVDHDAYRGNVTSITRYADAANRTSAVTEERLYDVTGNLISVSGSCCVETAYTYGPETQYAFPSAVTLGDLHVGAADQVTTQAKYDLGTGRVLESTDANGNGTYYVYYPDTQRLWTVESPPGSFIGYQYDDATMTITETAHLASGEIVSEVVRRLNGLGLDRRVEVLADDNLWNAVETQYDAMGRVLKQSHLFRQANRPESTDEQKYWDEITYDALGRVVRRTTADGSTTTQFYNETARPVSLTPGQTVRTVDPWGRERWTRTNALGQLMEVVMPKPSGGGSVFEPGSMTQYGYNALGQLLSSIQLSSKEPSQVRRFQYDSLGRLTQQYLPEKLGTLDSAGKYVGAGGQWSDVYSYDSRGNLTSTTDARGAKVIYDYHGDPLNRLQSIAYDLTGLGDPSSPVLPAGAVHLSYATSGDVARPVRITTDGLSTEDLGYDPLGRLLAKRTLTLNTAPGTPLTVGYTYDSLDRLRQLLYPHPSVFFSQGPQAVTYDFGATNQIRSVAVDGHDQASFKYDFSLRPQQIVLGAAGPYQLSENYAYDPKTQLLSHQSVMRNESTLLDLSYDYTRPPRPFEVKSTAQTGQITAVVDSVDPAASRTYTYDALGRLATAQSGTAQAGRAYDWLQKYSYDAYGNRTDVKAFGPLLLTTCPSPFCPTPPPPELPANQRDGLGPLTFNATTNRITTAGFAYDAAGNQIRTVRSDGRGQQYRYDVAGRLVEVLDENGKPVESYDYYNATRMRLSTRAGNPGDLPRVYVWDGNTVIAEYQRTIFSATPFQWIKSYIYAGGRLFSTRMPDASGTTELVQYHHPDRISTRLITNGGDSTVSQNETFSYGVDMPGRTTDITNQSFTSYDRSAATGLDYAVNRTYDSSLSRFTQVDPIGMQAVNMLNPQSLNMYGYVNNDPANTTDLLGLVDDADPGCGNLSDELAEEVCEPGGGGIGSGGGKEPPKYETVVRAKRKDPVPIDIPLPLGDISYGSEGGRSIGGGSRGNSAEKSDVSDPMDNKCTSQARRARDQAANSYVDARLGLENAQESLLAARYGLNSAVLSNRANMAEAFETGLSLEPGLRGLLKAQVSSYGRGANIGSSQDAVIGAEHSLKGATIGLVQAQRAVKRAQDDLRVSMEALNLCGN